MIRRAAVITVLSLSTGIAAQLLCEVSCTWATAHERPPACHDQRDVDRLSANHTACDHSSDDATLIQSVSKVTSIQHNGMTSEIDAHQGGAVAASLARGSYSPPGLALSAPVSHSVLRI